MSKRGIRHALNSHMRVTVPDHPEGVRSRVKSEFKDEVNINSIVAKMKRGISPPAWMTANTPRYEDVSNLPTSFAEAYDIVQRAEAAFDSLPLEFRREIDHDPRNIPNAPRELWERFKLTKTGPVDAVTAASTGPVGQGGTGDSDPPSNKPSGAKKRGSTPSEPSGD